MVYSVLALAFFERSSCQAVWDKLSAGLDAIAVTRPCASSPSRARRRLGSAPLRRLFEILAGPVAARTQTASFYRGLRVVAVDGTTLSIPDEKALTWRFPKHIGEVKEFGYPLLRLVALVESAPALCWGWPSVRTRPARSATRTAFCTTWTARWCWWPTPTTTPPTSWSP
jgi:hypothetical protein